MPINRISPIAFKGQRQDRNTVAQLKKDNNYDLNLPNQRNITEAIERLAQIKSEENIQFLLDVSNNLKYGTNINLGKKSDNDWRSKLHDAAERAIYSADNSVREKYLAELAKSKANRDLSADEKAVLAERDKLLACIDFNQVNNLTSANIRNIRSNLDYFIISSEVPISQKLYILKRLNHLMSDEYQINPQLSDKKNQVLAEIINDIVINTPESKIPNSKSINQLHHGICASISICRKDLAYEDKPNYVDMVLSELDNNPELMVYDINKLGSHTKIPMPKTYIDFKTAMDRGYRIVDTGAMQWMNVADTIGANNEAFGFYSPIDPNYFDTFTDAHMINDISPELSDKHDFYRGLIKAKSVIRDYKANVEKERYKSRKKYSERPQTLQLDKANSVLLRNLLYGIAGDRVPESKITKIYNDLLSLQVKNSKSAGNIKDYRKNYLFLPNEEIEAKREKIEKFIMKSLPKASLADVKAKSEEIAEIIEDLRTVPERNAGGVGKKMSDARSLFEAAAAYRAQQVLQLSVPEHNKTLMMQYGIPDQESAMIQNIDSLISQIESGTINPELQEKLAKNFEVDNDPEVLLEFLPALKEQIELISTKVLDKFYHSITLFDRQHALAVNMEYIKNEMDSPENTALISDIATSFQVNPTREDVQKYLSEKIELLESGNCSDEEYTYLFNQMGLKCQTAEFINCFAKIGELMFHENAENVIAGFNLLNGLPKDADRAQSMQAYENLANNFDNVNDLMNSYRRNLHIVDANGKILNTVEPKHKIIEELERQGEIPTAEELKALSRRFTQIDKYMANKDNNADGYADLPKVYTEFSKLEQDALNKYRADINLWYTVVLKRLNYLLRDIREPLEEHYRKTGVKTGRYWVSKECRSGLLSDQEVKIFEHMTDRPYYVEEDGDKAFEKIRNGHFSGISGTSVENKFPAMHAQYIADVKPVTMKNGETKYVVFHDNSWGPMEFKNTWVDNDGFVRTDYAREYGGDLGYITNSRYLNGNLAENVLYKAGEVKATTIGSKKYRKLKVNSDEEFRFPLLADVILPGTSPKANYEAGSLMTTFLVSPYQSLPELEKYAHNMTKAQIKKAMERGDAAGEHFEKIYEDMMKIINGMPPFDKGISTVEDYNKLPANNRLKILLDKIAIIQSYDNITDLKEFSQVGSAQDIVTLKKKVAAGAKKDFYYTFGKTFDIKNYVSFNSNKEIAEAIDNWVAKYGIEVKSKDLLPAIESLKSIDKSQFNGSMAHTIDLLSNNFRQAISKATPKFEDKANRVEEITREVERILVKDNYMDSADDIDMPNIEKWIDKTFAPTTNEEFVRIFNRLRDMSTSEFKKLYDSTIDDEALGIRNVSGYDVLKKLRAENYEVMNIMYNQIYKEEYYKELTTGKTKSHFDYNKFKREKNATVSYVNGKTFDDIYTDYSSSLSLLTMKRRFNATKAGNYRKYGVLPAYPVAQLSKDENFAQAMNEFYERIEYNIDSINAFRIAQDSIDIIRKLQKHIASYKTSDGNLSNRQLSSVIDLLNKFAEINHQDETMSSLIEEINNTINSADISKNRYKELVDKMYAEVSPYERTTYGDTMDVAIKKSLEYIKRDKKAFLEQLFDEKYQVKAAPILNKWIDAKANGNGKKKASDVEFYYNQFEKMYKQHSILKHPERLLNEFLMLNAKDAERQDPNISPERKEKLDARNDLLTAALKGSLFNANIISLQMQLMKYKRDGNLNALAKAFQNSKIELQDGSFIPVASAEGLNTLFSPLLKNENVDTLADFFNELGLNEVFMETITDDEQFARAKDTMKRIHSILASVDSQAKFVSKELAKLQDLDSDDEHYRERINEFGRRINEKVKRTNYRYPASLYQSAIADILQKFDASPGKSRVLIVNSTMDFAMDGIRDVVRANLKNLESDLERISEIESIIEKLQFPENSKGKELAEQYIKECDALRAFQRTLTKHYPNIGLHTS